MEAEGLIRALENSAEEAYLKMFDEGKTGMIFCRNLWSSSEFYSKKDGLRRLKNFLKIGLVTCIEYKKVKIEIRNSTTLPWKMNG